MQRDCRWIFWWSVVNLLTLFRVVCSSVLLFGNLTLAQAFGWALLGGVSDLEGKLAIEKNVATNWGGNFDKFSDKFYLFSCLVRLYYFWVEAANGIYLKVTTQILVGLLTSAELIIFICACLGLFVFKIKDIKANQWGRRKMGFEVAAVCVMIVSLIIHSRWESLHISIVVINALLLISNVLAYVSIFVYWRDYKKGG